jgi:hypothetical protein
VLDRGLQRFVVMRIITSYLFPPAKYVLDLCVFTMCFNLPLRKVQSSLTFLHNFSSKEALWICGKYIYHFKKPFDMKFSVVYRNLKNIWRKWCVVTIFTLYLKAKSCWFYGSMTVTNTQTLNFNFRLRFSSVFAYAY